jgi:hypothetical protein
LPFQIEDFRLKIGSLPISNLPIADLYIGWETQCDTSVAAIKLAIGQSEFGAVSNLKSEIFNLE